VTLLLLGRQANYVQVMDSTVSRPGPRTRGQASPQSPTALIPFDATTNKGEKEALQRSSKVWPSFNFFFFKKHLPEGL